MYFHGDKHVQKLVKTFSWVCNNRKKLTFGKFYLLENEIFRLVQCYIHEGIKCKINKSNYSMQGFLPLHWSDEKRTTYLIDILTGSGTLFETLWGVHCLLLLNHTFLIVCWAHTTPTDDVGNLDFRKIVGYTPAADK